jgi:PAS domain S-box-containing protein
MMQSKLATELPCRELLNVLPAAIYTTDAAGRVTYYNAAAVELAGRRPKIGSDEWCVTWRLYWPDGTPLPHDECPMAVALKTGRPVRGVEAIAERPDGTLVPFMPYPTPLHDASGNVVGAVNMLVDLTERSQAEQLRRVLASIVESSDDAIVSKDLNGVIASWNPGAERIFGYTADEVVGKSVTKLFPPDLQHEESAILERIRRGERIEHYETVRRRKDGRLVDVSLTVSPLRNAAGKITGVSKIARDVSARKKAEHDRLLALQEEERRRIANELHDSTAQHLVAIGLNLMKIRADAAREGKALDKLDEIDGLLEKAATELRAFTYLLYPPDLQSEGLAVTLGRYVEGFSTRTGLKITVNSCPGVDLLSLSLQQALLRIVQEALANVYRHASATCVSVNFRLVGEKLDLVISDDGRGAEEVTAHQSGKPLRVGVGIPGMIARMHQFGGTLQVHSGPNGTTVHATVPVDRHTSRGRANGHPVGDPLGASAGHQGNASQCVRVGAD